MTPLHQLLSRIRWDPAFAGARIEIGYLDRRQAGLARVALDRVSWGPASAFAFDVVREDGTVQSIPFHRVLEVRRDGKLIWARLAPRTLRKTSAPRPRARRTASRPPAGGSRFSRRGAAR